MRHVHLLRQSLASMIPFHLRTLIRISAVSTHVAMAAECVIRTSHLRIYLPQVPGTQRLPFPRRTPETALASYLPECVCDNIYCTEWFDRHTWRRLQWKCTVSGMPVLVGRAKCHHDFVDASLWTSCTEWPRCHCAYGIYSVLSVSRIIFALEWYPWLDHEYCLWIVIERAKSEIRLDWLRCSRIYRDKWRQFTYIRFRVRHADCANSCDVSRVGCASVGTSDRCKGIADASISPSWFW